MWIMWDAYPINKITAIRLPPMAETDSRKIIILKKEEQPDQRRLPERLEDAEPPI